jgi:hypothetical protein
VEIFRTAMKYSWRRKKEADGDKSNENNPSAMNGADKAPIE